MYSLSPQDDGGPAACLAFVLIDGLGDTNVLQLGRRTPLQAANIPVLDGVAGDCLLYTVALPCLMSLSQHFLASKFIV